LDKFEVYESNFDDISVAYLSEEKMKELKILQGDTILIRTKRRKEAVCIAIMKQDMDKTQIKLNNYLMKSLRLKTKEKIEVNLLQNISNVSKVKILPFLETIKHLHFEVHEYLIKYFKDSYRPINRGSTFKIHNIEFMVVEIEPSEYGIVSPDTVIYSEGEPLLR
jgi:transitional endoplasmic reticulum ATPase